MEQMWNSTGLSGGLSGGAEWGLTGGGGLESARMLAFKEMTA